MRNRIELTGNWKFKIDPNNQGEKDSWFLDLDTEKIVEVPHIWQQEDEFLNYCGAAWYEKTIVNDGRMASNDYYLCFNAVDYQSQVWWNGAYIGSHEGGFTPFEFKIDDNLLRQTNTLIVRVYDPADNAEIPIGKQGSWYTRVSGIWQSVYLEERSKKYIANAYITPNFDEKTLTVDLKIDGSEVEQGDIDYSIRPHSLGEEDWLSKDNLYEGSFSSAESVFSVENHTINNTIEVNNIKTWSPDKPYLYEITFKLRSGDQVDIFSTTFGFRKIEQRNGKIYLNNEELYIRGALDQAFYPDTVYIAPSKEYIKNEIRLAKEMGFNLLRKHIKVELPEYLYWADRMGMLIWAEHPNYVKWTPAASKRFVTGLKEMIDRDYNHPSIIIWSIYNEEWGLEWDLEFDKEKQEHVRQLYHQVKLWDSSRLICDNSGWSHVITDINDYHRYFVIPDQLAQWEEDLDQFIIGNSNANFVEGVEAGNEPKIVSEFGVWGLPNVNKLKEFYQGKEPWWFINQGEESHQDDYKKPFTLFENFESYGISDAVRDLDNLAVLSQKRMFRAVKSLIEEMRKRPEISGYVVTEFTDIEWETNGWLDYLRQPKQGFEKLKNFNGETCIMVDLPKRNLRSNESINFDIYITNELKNPIDAVAKYTLKVNGSSEIIQGEAEVKLNTSFLHLPNHFNFTVPKVESSSFAQLTVELWVDGVKIAENEEELTITNESNQSTSNVSLYVNSSSELLEAVLKEKGFAIKSRLEDADVVLTEKLDEEILRFISAGGRVVFLAEKGDALEEKGELTFRKLDHGESWARASSMNYINTTRFKGLPINTEMGWEFEGLLPSYVIPFGDYKKTNNNRTIHMYGNPDLGENSEVIAGYFQGWLGQNGGIIIKQEQGKGIVLTTTLKLIENIKDQPIAYLLLENIIAQLINNEGGETC